MISHHTVSRNNEKAYYWPERRLGHVMDLLDLEEIHGSGSWDQFKDPGDPRVRRFYISRGHSHLDRSFVLNNNSLLYFLQYT